MSAKKITVTKEQRKAIRDARKIVEEVLKMDGNEAETRRRVERIFESVMGYNAFKHLSRERAVKGAGETEHVDFAIQLEAGPDAHPCVMVELKRVGIELAKKHLSQIISYAINVGCEWVLLTNSKEWKIYHIEFSQPPKIEILETWNLLEDDVNDLVSKFEIINYKSIKHDGLNRMWKRVKVLAPGSLLSAIIAEDTLRTIRRNLRKDTGILVNDEEVYAGIGKLLNEAAAIAMSKVKMAKRSTHARKKTTSKKAAKKVETQELAKPQATHEADIDSKTE